MAYKLIWKCKKITDTGTKARIGDFFFTHSNLIEKPA